MHARAYSHATENLDKVEQAVLNLVGDCELNVSMTEGHHGNPIHIVEAFLQGGKEISSFFSRLGDRVLRELDESLEQRMDDSCNLFMRFEKQAALMDDLRLARTDDAIQVRLKVRAFPAKSEAAVSEARAFIRSELEGRTEGH